MSQYVSPDLLAERLDRALPPGISSLPPATTDPLVNIAADIARLRLPSLSPSASTRIEGRMLAVFNEQRRQRSGTRSLQAGLTTFGRWALVASVLLVLLVGALTPAAAASVPGELLYSVKQFYERVELAAAASPSAKATVYLSHARRRTQEALVLLERNQFDAGLIDAALSDIDEAGKTPDDVRASAQLRAEVLQVQALLGFVLNNAQQTGLTTQAEILQHAEQVQELGQSELLLPLPAQEHNPNAQTETATPTPTPTWTPTPEAQSSSATLEATPTCENGRSCLAPGQATDDPLAPTCENGKSCLAPGQATVDPLIATCENGKSCLSHGTPGATSTPRPTRAPPTRRPTQPSGQGGGSGGNGGNNNGGGNSAGGNSGGNNSGGNDNGGGNSAGGNSGGNDNAGGGNAGGGNSGGGGKP